VRKLLREVQLVKVHIRREGALAARNVAQRRDLLATDRLAVERCDEVLQCRHARGRSLLQKGGRHRDRS
jgi:hypothetical protein